MGSAGRFSQRKLQMFSQEIAGAAGTRQQIADCPLSPQVCPLPQKEELKKALAASDRGSAQTLTGTAFRAAGKSGKNLAAASKSARKAFQ